MNPIELERDLLFKSKSFFTLLYKKQKRRIVIAVSANSVLPYKENAKSLLLSTRTIIKKNNYLTE